MSCVILVHPSRAAEGLGAILHSSSLQIVYMVQNVICQHCCAAVQTDIALKLW